jgi:hypothetical protein
VNADDTRTERIARNEVSLRRVNEAIESGRQTREGLVPFVCECGVLGCNDVIELTLEEYEQVRSRGVRFLVAPGHQSEADEVVETRGRYDIVEKAEARAAAIAERTDPRGPGAPER